MADRAVVVGSGAGASIVTMVLAEAGWDVVVLERGPWYITDRDRPTTLFSSDEMKANRTPRAGKGRQPAVGISSLPGSELNWSELPVYGGRAPSMRT